MAANLLAHETKMILESASRFIQMAPSKRDDILSVATLRYLEIRGQGHLPATMAAAIQNAVRDYLYEDHLVPCPPSHESFPSVTSLSAGKEEAAVKEALELFARQDSGTLQEIFEHLNLSVREKSVAQRLVEGYKEYEIAQYLELSESEISRVVSSIKDKYIRRKNHD